MIGKQSTTSEWEILRKIVLWEEEPYFLYLLNLNSENLQHFMDVLADV
jgi:hypothetical protein